MTILSPSNRRTWLLAAALALLVAMAGYWFVRRSEFMRVDACLDRGGRWNHDVGACEGVRP